VTVVPGGGSGGRGEVFSLVSSTVVGEHGFLSVLDDRFVGPEGEIARWTIRHPGAVVAVPVEHTPDGPVVVMVRQFRSAVRASILEVPAGKRDVDDEPPEVTAARECEEEIGLRPLTIVKLAEFYNSPGFTDEHTHVYLATDLEPVDQPPDLKAEEQHMTIERIPLSEVDGLIARGELVDAKSIIGLLLAQRHLAGRGPDGGGR
jgi:8-oxo-dGTP pyrophosphatase MutT (NUDIX family)